MSDQYTQFKAQHQITFETAEEDLYRQSIFFENVRYIQAENAKNNSYKLGVNLMILLTDAEYTALFLNLHEQQSIDIVDAKIDETEEENAADLPTEVNWTAQGAVTPVKN